MQYGTVGTAVEEFWSPWRKAEPVKQRLLRILDTLKSLFDKKTILEMLQHYTVFATDPKGKKIKIIARYPQYEAVNLIVQRLRRKNQTWIDLALSRIWQISSNGFCCFKIEISSKTKQSYNFDCS